MKLRIQIPISEVEVGAAPPDPTKSLDQYIAASLKSLDTTAKRIREALQSIPGITEEVCIKGFLYYDVQKLYATMTHNLIKLETISKTEGVPIENIIESNYLLFTVIMPDQFEITVDLLEAIQNTVRDGIIHFYE